MSARGTKHGLFCLALAGLWLVALGRPAEAVVPVIVGPLQALLAILPSLLVALGAALLAMFRPSFIKKLVRFLWHQKAFTAILIGVVAGAVFASRHTWGRASAAASEMRAGSDWTAFRGGPSRRGAILDAPEPNLPDTVWSFKTDAKIIFASPAVVGNRVYVTTADKGVFSDRGALLCLDAETGAEVWRYSPGGFRATFSSPAVKDGFIVCGEGLHYTSDARINCLDLGGKLLWELRTKSHVESSPCIYNGRVYIGAGDDGYYCLDLKPGPDGQPKVVWHLGGERYRDCETSPIAADGVVYFGLGMAGNAVVAADADTGRELWRLDAPYPVFAPPTLANGRLYVGMGNGNFVETAEQVRDTIVKKMREAGKPAAEIAAAEKRLGPAGEVWCIEPRTGKIDWKFAVPRTVLGAIAAAGDRLYFGSRDGRLYCVSAAGKPIKSWDAHSPIMTSPAVGAEHVYFGTAAGRLHCLKADTLEPVWDTSLGDGANFMSSPALALGHVYVGTDGEGLRCIGRAGEKAAPLWSDGARGGADASPLPERGVLAWRFPRGEGDEKFAVTAPLMPLGDALYAACTRGGKPQLLKLKLGREAKEDAERVAWAAPLPHAVTVPPVGLGHCIYIVAGAPDQTGRTLRCLDAEDGRELWQFPLGVGASGQLALDRRHLYLWTAPDTLTCLSVEKPARGLTVWARQFGLGTVAPAPGAGILTVATRDALLAADDGSGTVLWKVALKHSPAFAPIRLAKAIVLAGESAIAVHRLVNGSEVWRTPFPQAPHFVSPPVANEDRIDAATAATQLVSLRTSDGESLVKSVEAWGRPSPLRAGDALLFAAKDIVVLRDGEEQPRQWARTSWLGRFATPLVLHEGHVYFATEEKGIVCVGPARR